MRRQLHVTERPAPNDRDMPPLLFVHGGYTHGGCWAVNFLDWFAAQGYHSYALDLSGHGKSAGLEQLNDFGLDDYADDVRQAVATLDAAPVLIGHSMGAIVVQRYLEQSPASGVVMMSPVPPSGLSGPAMRLAIRQPDFLAEAERAIRGEFSENTVRVMREVYFSPDADEANFAEFQPLLQDESMRAVSDLMLLAMRLPTKRPRMPALVMGGELDALFAANHLHFTAAGWNAEISIVPRAGHMLMLDPQWIQAAEAIDEWLQRHFARRPMVINA